MTTVNPGRDLSVSLAPGDVLTIVPTSIGAGTVFDVERPGSAMPFSAGARKLIGPFPTDRFYVVSLSAGSAEVSVLPYDLAYSALAGNVEGFTGNRILSNDDMGKIFRCEDGSGVTVTVPADLIEGFNVGLAQWGAGAITVAAGSGATSRSSESATTAQYGTASVIVVKNPTGAAAEFVIKGDVA